MKTVPLVLVPVLLAGTPLGCVGEEVTLPEVARLESSIMNLAPLLCDSIPQIETNNARDEELRSRLHGRCSSLLAAPVEVDTVFLGS